MLGEASSEGPLARLLALPENGRENELLLRAYRQVDAVDAVEGVQHGLDLRAKVQKFEYEKDWASALVGWDGLRKLLPAGQSQDMHHLQRVMRHFGLASLSAEIGGSPPHQESEPLLNAMAEGDARKFELEVDRMRHGLIRQLLHLETTSLAPAVLSKFQSLQELQQLFALRWRKAQASAAAVGQELRRLSRKWDEQSLGLCAGVDTAHESSFQVCQPLFELRREALQRVRQSLADEGHAPVDGALLHQLLTLSMIARQSGEQGIARNLIHEIQHAFAGRAVGGAEDVLDVVYLRLEQAHDCWNGKERKNAILVLRSVVAALKGLLEQSTAEAEAEAEMKFRLKQTLARSLRLAGQWLDETSTEDWRIIERDYLGASTQVLDSGNSANHALLGTCYLALARYIDRRFRGIKSRVESSAWKQAYRHQLAREAELQELKQQEAERKRQRKRGKSKKEAQMALRIYLARLEKQCENDKDERTRVLSAYKDLLLRAIRNYGTSLCFLTTDTNLSQGSSAFDQFGDHGHSRSSEIRTIFRLVALWFEHSTKRVVNQEIAALVCADAGQKAPISSSGPAQLIPSYKFLPLLYQIASRIGTVTEVFERESVALAWLDKAEGGKQKAWSFEQVVSSLMTRLGKDHPFHTLPHLIALKNGAVLSDSSQKGSAGFSSISSDKNKRRVAEQILKLIGHSRTRCASGGEIKLGNVVLSYDKVSSAFRHIAYHPVQKKLQQIRLSDVNRFERDINAVDLSSVAVPVADVPVQKDARYNFSTAGVGAADSVTCMDPSNPFPSGSCSVASNGASRPKVLECRGTNGKIYKMLVKGGDDLRQDAVMEQLFGLVNILLRNEAATRQRNLHLRTYKVVPLSPDSGIIEWVEGTTAIGEYLHGGMKASGFSDSAHGRHNDNPNSITFLKAFQQMREAAQAKPKHSERGVVNGKLAAFRAVCRRFAPVFRHFFMEMFPDPVGWYRSRVAYTRSAAVNSIVGYVVGIGDRHTHNILIDTDTAELVHIDFGFVFEQSKALRIPEVVPFRLTRDIVDAMGVTGTEGTFERCCEETLKVLRANSEVLLTICEVFIHDPLYQWTLSPTKAAKAQPEMAIDKGKALSLQTTEEEDKDKEPTNATREAERALIRLHQKLQGYEDPNGNALSITGQVKYLIKQASSDENLCQMFEGWSAWV